MPHFIVIGVPSEKRVSLFQAALARLGQPPATVLAYSDILGTKVHLRDYVRDGSILRLESGGKDVETLRLFLQYGATDSSSSVAQVDDKGRIFSPYQIYQGMKSAFAQIEAQLQECPPHRWMNPPQDVLLMFDKPRCYEHLQTQGIHLPRRLVCPAPLEFAQVQALMQTHAMPAVFIKLAHGSSASGALAYRQHVRLQAHQALTTVTETAPALYNSRRIRTLTDETAIAALYARLRQLDELQIEEWLPKAGINGQVFDLRIITIGGKVKHSVARLSQTPFTNLHLLNQRGDVAEIRARMRPARWEALLATCEQVAQAFPHSLYMGIDVMIRADWRSHAVLEVNAFGDLLNDVLYEGQDTYTHEIEALL